MAFISIYSNSNGSWGAKATLFPTKATLVKELSYPVELYYSRTDINGSSIMERDICNDRNALLASLNNIGACYNQIESLWNFDSEKPIGKNLKSIFDTAYEAKLLIVQQEMANAFLDDF